MYGISVPFLKSTAFRLRRENDRPVRDVAYEISRLHVVYDIARPPCTMKITFLSGDTNVNRVSCHFPGIVVPGAGGWDVICGGLGKL